MVMMVIKLTKLFKWLEGWVWGRIREGSNGSEATGWNLFLEDLDKRPWKGGEVSEAADKKPLKPGAHKNGWSKATGQD